MDAQGGSDDYKGKIGVLLRSEKYQGLKVESRELSLDLIQISDDWDELHLKELEVGLVMFPMFTADEDAPRLTDGRQTPPSGRL